MAWHVAGLPEAEPSCHHEACCGGASAYYTPLALWGGCSMSKIVVGITDFITDRTRMACNIELTWINNGIRSLRWLDSDWCNWCWWCCSRKVLVLATITNRCYFQSSLHLALAIMCACWTLLVGVGKGLLQTTTRYTHDKTKRKQNKHSSVSCLMAGPQRCTCRARAISKGTVLQACLPCAQLKRSETSLNMKCSHVNIHYLKVFVY